MSGKVLKICSYVLLAVGTVVVLFPFLWALLLSVKTNAEILSVPPAFFPKELNFEGYVTVFTGSPIFRWFSNSLVVAAAVVAINCFTSALGGYVFAKFSFAFKNTLFLLLLSTMMVPFQVTMVPLYLLCSKLHIVETLWSLILPSMVSAFGIFLCRQFIANVPNELLEAGRIEGAGEMRIFTHLIIPIIKPSLAALAIFTFIGKWNDYMWPLIAISDQNQMTIPIALTYFNSARAIDINATMSASIIIMIPIVLVFLIFQKQFIEGMTISGMK